MRRTARMPFAAVAASLALALVLAPRPAAAVNSIEGVTSTIFQKNQSSFSGIGIRMRVEMAQLAEGFSLLPSMAYWRSKNTLEDFGLEVVRKDATLATLLRYDFKREGWKPYLGAGIGLHFLESEVDAPSLGLNNESESVVRGGLAMLGGVKFGVAGKLSNMVELEYHHVPDQSQFKFNWGLSYDF